MIRQLGNHLGKWIALGYDHHASEEIAAYVQTLSRFGIVVPAVSGPDLYWIDSARVVCRAIQRKKDRIGVLLCSTGIGMSIAANKFRGIYAARCVTEDDARGARTINNANVLCLALRSGVETNRKIIAAFMETPFEGRKVEQLSEITTLEIERPAPSHGSRSPQPVFARDQRAVR
ncbi:MAG: RpiB/LacA/LacB family sugar-phosphate isomerase [Deltaproteobacteria bacterium]|nr:RpiB/LacA/LacB family sugar-phosphate isomerase [Deltaproteobacteria bacterium]